MHVIEYLFYVNWNLGNNISNNANIDQIFYYSLMCIPFFIKIY
jgi:hypothetical protein